MKSYLVSRLGTAGAMAFPVAVRQRLHPGLGTRTNNGRVRLDRSPRSRWARELSQSGRHASSSASLPGCRLVAPPCWVSRGRILIRVGFFRLEGVHSSSDWTKQTPASRSRFETCVGLSPWRFGAAVRTNETASVEGNLKMNLVNMYLKIRRGIRSGNWEARTNETPS